MTILTPPHSVHSHYVLLSFPLLSNRLLTHVSWAPSIRFLSARDLTKIYKIISHEVFGAWTWNIAYTLNEFMVDMKMSHCCGRGAQKFPARVRRGGIAGFVDHTEWSRQYCCIYICCFIQAVRKNTHAT